MSLIRKSLFGAALALALVSAPAQAILINDTGDDFLIVWNQFQGTNQLRASASFDVTSVSATQIIIDIDISNLSVLTTFVNAGINSFGLETNPIASSVSVGGGTVFLNADLSSIPSLNFINLCIFTTNNCAGGPQGDALAVLASDSLTLTINGTFPTGLDVVNSGIKFQTSGGSFEFPGTICAPGDPNCGDIKIPEPSSLLLLGLGALAAAAARRRRTI